MPQCNPDASRSITKSLVFQGKGNDSLVAICKKRIFRHLQIASSIESRLLGCSTAISCFFPNASHLIVMRGMARFMRSTRIDLENSSGNGKKGAVR
jgi:hypothetical protein